MLGLVGQVRAPVLQLGNARLRVVRIVPILIRSLVGSLTIELRQLLPCGRSNPRFLRQPPEKLLIVLARLPSHNRTQAAFASKVVASMPTVFPFSRPFSAKSCSTQR